MEHEKPHEDIARLFKKLPTISPPETLYATTMASIARAEERKLRMRFAFYAFTGICSTTLLFPALRYTQAQFAQSGFIEYLSLVFSDGGILSLYWKEFLITLLETFPILGITLVLIALFGVLNALRLTIGSTGRTVIHRFA